MLGLEVDWLGACVVSLVTSTDVGIMSVEDVVAMVVVGIPAGKAGTPAFSRQANMLSHIPTHPRSKARQSYRRRWKRVHADESKGGFQSTWLCNYVRTFVFSHLE